MSAQDLTAAELVSSRYVEMQGLRRAVDGVSLLVLWTLIRMGSPDGSPPSYLGASLLWAGGTIWAGSRVSRYYRERFPLPVDGQVREEQPRSLAYAPFRLIFVSSAMWLGGWFAALLPILTLRAGYVAWRDRPHRPHWLLPVLVGTAFSFAYLAVSNSADFLEWQWRFIWTAAPALIVAGILDHRVLARALRRPTPPARVNEHADTV